MVDFSDRSVTVIRSLRAAWAKKTTHELAARGDKSVTHRSIMFAGLAAGDSKIWNPLLGEDCLTTASVMKKLGCQVTLPSTHEGSLDVSSPGFDGWNKNPEKLDFGNSGTTARLMTGILASCPNLVASCAGDESLSARPMARVLEPLKNMGGTFESIDGGKSGFLPFLIRGKSLRPVAIRSDKASAQVKSAIILAGLNISGETAVTLPAGGRDHTERILKGFGANISSKDVGTDELIKIVGPFRLKSFNARVPNDPSSAAFLCALPLVHRAGGVLVREVMTNSGRTHFLQIMRRMGADFKFENARTKDANGIHYMEEVADLRLNWGGKLRGIETTAEEAAQIIDEIPILASIACFADFPSIFRGLHELRVKESDRLAATARLVQSAGAEFEIKGDDLIVKPTGKPVEGFVFDPHGDHRLAMAAAVILSTGLKSEGGVIGAACADVSFPGFFDLLASFC
jgi:3-phosphoshikimate 1-carboxyvinyltransferase